MLQYYGGGSYQLFPYQQYNPPAQVMQVATFTTYAYEGPGRISTDISPIFSILDIPGVWSTALLQVQFFRDILNLAMHHPQLPYNHSTLVRRLSKHLSPMILRMHLRSYSLYVAN
jgi:hypothetical protein